ncbi:MAG: stage V sporulation protein AC [Clostridia bacterium]|nr:stage V sporulation protein AC [Clostridia bacterium]
MPMQNPKHKQRSQEPTPEQKRYIEMVNRQKPKPPVFKNVVLAFLFGGLVSIIGQALTFFYMQVLDLSPVEAGGPVSATIIFIASLLTGFGVYDKIAKYAGAGLAVPVTGFANSMTSAALEFKREGLVLGVGSKMFVLAGSVIVFGVFSAMLVGLISALI